MRQEIETQLREQLQAYVRHTAAVSDADFAEIKAILTTVCRSLARKMQQRRESASSSRDLLAKVNNLVRLRLVDEEGLMTASQWQEAQGQTGGATQARAAPASPVPAARAAPASPAPARAAAAPPAAAAATADPKKAAVVAELRRLFPGSSESDMAAAAAQGENLEEAVFYLLSTERIDLASMEGEDVSVAYDDSAAAARPAAVAAPAATRPAAAAASPAAAARLTASPAAAARPAAAVGGGAFTLTTPPVTTGQCSFGLCFDITAKELPVTITGLRTAASPGLNWGQGQPLKVSVFATNELWTGRGLELDASQWQRFGYDPQCTLPMVSWADASPDYGRVPLDEPVTIPAGKTRGFLIHTSDLYGLVNSVGMGAGGCDELLGLNDDDATPPLRAGSFVADDERITLSAGLTIGAAVFEEFDGFSVPTACAFVGVIEYAS